MYPAGFFLLGLLKRFSANSYEELFSVSLPQEDQRPCCARHCVASFKDCAVIKMFCFLLVFRMQIWFLRTSLAKI